MSTKGVGRCMALVGLIVGVVFAAGLRSASAVDGPVFATPSAGNTAAPQGQKWPITMAGTSVPLAMGCGAEKRVLWYGAGAVADVLWRNITFPASGASTHTTTAVSMGGTFKPFTGDFDGDGCEDVFWYPAAGGAGSVWYFAANGTHTSKAVALAPAATPLVGRFNSDGRDDIFWYVPGAGRESIWLGAAARTFTPAVAPQMAGLFAPVMAVDASSILWYRAGTASDLLWRGVKAGATKPTSTATLSVNGSYALRNFGGSALLYAPGAAADLLITGVSPAPVKLRTLSGRFDATYVITNSTAKAGFGVLSAAGAGQDFLVKPRAAVAPPPTTTTTTTTTTAPLDSDGDGIPDSIDPCPNVANPGNGPCPYTVYELRNGTVAAGSKVSVSNLLVTFVKGDASRAWAQVKVGDATYSNIDGPQHSGLEIDLSQVSTAIAAGDRIDVAGTLAADGTVTASSLTLVSALSESLPAAVDVGTDASAGTLGVYDDVLVKAGPAQVDATTANSFSLGFSTPLVVENSLASLTIPTVGAQISSVVGILRVDDLGTALRPRSDADIVVASPPVMGNGLVEAGEQCDDGNTANGDGCSNVGTIESGYLCSGSPSTCNTVMGDGIVAGAEQCDDGNIASGDGCSATGTAEAGYSCIGSPSSCSTVMGDGIRAGAEQCDDGNTANGDGCSNVGTIESGYICSGSLSTCNTVAGDGIVAGSEQCDDGNVINGDGCSTFATTELGYSCTGSPSTCAPVFGDGLVVGAEECDDGNTTSGDGCSNVGTIESGFICSGSPSVCLSNSRATVLLRKQRRA